MVHFLSFFIFLQAAFVYAAPAIVFKTVQAPPKFVTEYAGGASPGGNVAYKTLWSNAVSYTKTLWPTTAAPYTTVQPQPQPPAKTAAPPPPPPEKSAAPPPPPPAETSQAPPPAAPPAETSQAPPPPPAKSSPAPPAPVTHTSQAPPPPATHSQAPPPVTHTSQKPSPSPSPSPSKTTSTAINGPKVTSVPKYMVYSPFADDHSCKDADTVKSDLQNLASKGVKRIRMYATDCNSLETVQPAAKELGLRIVQGLWIGTAGIQNALNQLNDLVKSANGDWSNYDSIIVGNEDVTNGFISAQDLLNTVNTARGKLRGNGYQGPVIIAETTTAYINNADVLCDSSLPYVGLNAHSYFSPSFTAQRAGEFIKDQMGIVAGKCGRSDIWISETGYPHKGDTYGDNVPTKQNQADALNAILEVTNQDCVVLAQYNDMWKDPGPHNVEQYFGMVDILV